MSTRERWIVYPLLFLAIGLGLRNKLLPPSRFGGINETAIKAAEIDAKLIRCGELQTPKALIGQTESMHAECRRLVVVGPNGRPAIIAATDNRTGSGVLETFAADGRPLVQLHSTDAGGVVVTISRSGRVLVIGDAGQVDPDREADAQPAAAQPPEGEQPNQPSENPEKPDFNRL
ncbi:MAG: hypothetical protein GX594_10285 [Pirellulaceae bacterium]|nr:hypothetical protein [Pirellulaceae bacterium]